MKRVGKLFRRIAEIENLELAFWKAQRGKTGKEEVRIFRADLMENLRKLREDLLSGECPVGDYHFFTIQDPKERQICAASFWERVLQHAVVNICEPYFEKYQIYDSYACRKGKGMDPCLRRCRYFCSCYDRYLKLDIHKYFDSINHVVLMRFLERHFKDPELLYFFQRLIDSYETAPGCGIPIGNLTSQYFANMYLGVLDHVIKDKLRVPGYVRYMDDFVLFSDRSEDIKCYLEHIEEFAHDELRLSLNPPQSNLTDAGISFLSYRVFSDKLRLSLKAKRRFRQKIAIANRMEDAGKALPLLAFVKRADCDGFLRSIFREATPKGRTG